MNMLKIDQIKCLIFEKKCWDLNSPRVSLDRNLRRFRRWQVRQVEAMRCRREWHRQLAVENAGSLDCRFKLNTHKMVFVMNSEDYMYRRGALVKARKVELEFLFNTWRAKLKCLFLLVYF